MGSGIRLSLGLCLTFTAACAGGGSEADDLASPLPNILVVVLDDVGTDLVGSYAQHRDAVTLPVIDDLARKGVSFDAVWAQSLCSPTRAGILTGLHPIESGIGENVTDSGLTTGLFPTLPEVAKQSGYRTFAVGKWHLGPWRPFADVDHVNEIGFDYFAGSLGNIRRTNNQSYFRWPKIVNGNSIPDHDVYATTDAVDEAITQIKLHQEQPWLGWVAFHAVHVPHELPPAGLFYSTSSSNPDAPELARLMLEAIDIELGRLLQSLPAGRPSTLFIVGDNGTSELVKTPPMIPGHAKNSLYEGGLRVPLIVQGHGVAADARGRRSAALIHAIDLFATITHLIRGQPEDTPSALSFLSCLGDPEQCTHRDTVYSEHFSPNNPISGQLPIEHAQAARGTRYKLILGATGYEEFYDLLTDPEETTDLLNGPLTVEQEIAHLGLRTHLLARRKPPDQADRRATRPQELVVPGPHLPGSRQRKPRDWARPVQLEPDALSPALPGAEAPPDPIGPSLRSPDSASSNREILATEDAKWAHARPGRSQAAPAPSSPLSFAIAHRLELYCLAVATVLAITLLPRRTPGTQTANTAVQFSRKIAPPQGTHGNLS